MSFAILLDKIAKQKRVVNLLINTLTANACNFFSWTEKIRSRHIYIFVTKYDKKKLTGVFFYLYRSCLSFGLFIYLLYEIMRVWLVN